jgi:CheY-like chemotaxis protein
MAVPKDHYILIVEDDPDQADFIANALRQRFPHHEVELVETESAFHERLPEFAQNPPEVAVVDVILRWSDPDLIPRRPPDVVSGGFQKAGLRCEQLLRQNPLTARVPVILYTITSAAHHAEYLDAANRERRERALPEVEFLEKDPDIGPLITAVRDRLS